MSEDLNLLEEPQVFAASEGWVEAALDCMKLPEFAEVSVTLKGSSAFTLAPYSVMISTPDDEVFERFFTAIIERVTFGEVER